MCKYEPRFFVAHKFLATGKKSERQGDNWTDRSAHFKELPHYTQVQ